MYTYNNGIVKLENDTRKIFYNYQYKITEFIYDNLNTTTLSYNDFRLKCLSFLEQKKLDKLFDDLLKESKKQIDLTANSFDLKISNELYLYSNKKVYDELYELFKNKIDETIDHYFNVYLNIKKQAAVSLNDNVLNLLTKYSYQYRTFNFKRLLNKLKQDNENVYDVLVNTNFVLAQTKLNALKYQYNSLNTYQRQVKSESGQRNYNLSDYLVLAVVYNMRTLFWNNLKTIYDDNDIKFVKWLNTEPATICPECEKFYEQVFPLNAMKEQPPMHARCNCVLVPHNNSKRKFEKSIEHRKMPNKKIRTNFERKIKNLTNQK